MPPPPLVPSPGLEPPPPLLRNSDMFPLALGGRRKGLGLKDSAASKPSTCSAGPPEARGAVDTGAVSDLASWLSVGLETASDWVGRGDCGAVSVGMFSEDMGRTPDAANDMRTCLPYASTIPALP